MALDMHEIQHLTDEQKERYMLLQRFFESEYWTLFKRWADANAGESLQRLIHASSWDANRIAFGQMLAYKNLLELEQSVDLEFANYAAEAAEKAQVEAEGEHE
jgi:hypothetical protein